MTDLQISLSSDLQSSLGKSGAYAYAVYFTKAGDGTDVAHWTTMVDNGVVQDSGSYTIGIEQPYIGGKVYFLIQSLDAASSANQASSVITTESQINWDNATTYDFRYDSIEMTLTPSINDDGNLTSVNGFGIPMSLSVTQNGVESSRGYLVSANTIFSDVSAINDDLVLTYTEGPLAGQSRMAASSAEAVSADLSGFAASDWKPYLELLKTATDPVRVSGLFNGAPDSANVWHNAGTFAYTLSWDGDYFWLTPDASSEIRGAIRITEDDLANSIYSTLGTADIFSDDGSTLFLADMNTGANNQWGKVFTALLTGFSAGYLGGTGDTADINLHNPGSVNLNDSWNWDPSYAFLSKRLDQATDPQYYDKYAQVFFLNSNSYGSGYSDELTQAYTEGGPLLSLANADGSDVSTINIALFSDTETPTGYTTPVLLNNVATTDYATLSDHSQANLSSNIVLNFTCGTSQLTDDLDLVSMGIFTGLDASGNPQFTKVSFSDNDNTGTLFRNWNLLYDQNTGYYFQAYPTGDYQPVGNLLINQLPIAANGVNWFQFYVGTGDDTKTYNFYLTADASGNIENPTYTGADQSETMAIDGLAQIAVSTSFAGDQTINTLTLDFLPGSTVTFDPDNLTQITDPTTINQPGVSTFPTPQAPQVGTLSGSTFTQAPDLQSIADATVAFGWTGADAAYVKQQAALENFIISTYTNKVGALNTAQINVYSDAAMTQRVGSPINVTADLDGDWISANQTLGEGTYYTTMTEYAAGELTSPLAKVSDTQAFKIDITETTLAVSDDGQALCLAKADGVSGNWVNLYVWQSLPEKATLLAYATDAQGNPIARDGGTGSSVTVEDAALARIGSVADDNGELLSIANTYFYLPSDQYVKFAIVTADNEILLPEQTQISGGGLVGIDLSYGDQTYPLTAWIDNSLSSVGSQVSAQRSMDLPVLYLEDGATVTYRVVAASTTSDTIGFVKVDIDPTTKEWSVDGVAAGDTQALRQAAQANRDTGSLVTSTASDSFTSTHTWTVSGGSGYYIPVLTTETGNILIPGTDNEDGQEHVRLFGDASYSFEDMLASQGSDFDFNDFALRVTAIST